MERPHHAAVLLLCIAVLSVGLGAVALSVRLPAERCAPLWLGGACSSNADLKAWIAIGGLALVAADAVFYAVTRRLEDDPAAD